MSRIVFIPGGHLQTTTPQSATASFSGEGIQAISAGDFTAIAPGADALLLETGDFILQEDGTSHILIE